MGRLFIAGQEELASPSLRKTISSRKGLCSLPLLTNWNPTLWWRSYYALKILIVWLAPHRMQAAELRELASWTLLRLLAIPSAGIWGLSKGTTPFRRVT